MVLALCGSKEYVVLYIMNGVVVGSVGGREYI